MNKFFLGYLSITIFILTLTISNVLSSDFGVTLVSEKIEYNKTYNEAKDFKDNNITENKSDSSKNNKIGILGRVILDDKQIVFNKLLLKTIILVLILGLITYYFINKSKS